MNCPTPLFDALEHIKETKNYIVKNISNRVDFKMARKFLQSYIGSKGTFNAYRREVERLLQWSWLIANKTLKKLKREDVEAFIRFCQKPPKSWIGTKKLPRFIEKQGARIPNPAWRPFVAIISKAEHRKGYIVSKNDHELSQTAIKDTFAILSTFYNYLLQEEYVSVNPIALIRQKSKFLRKQQSKPKIRRLTNLQWQQVINAAKDMAEYEPKLHERTLFVLSALYSMYLRISELTASDRWIPKMNDFYRDQDGNWWFTTVGKGNKQRQIAVSDAMLKALKRWRKYLKLSSLPSPSDSFPLLPKAKGKGAIKNTNSIRLFVQQCFDKAIVQLGKNGNKEEAESLLEATVHWLRHTGISEDVKCRPREHVRDDAGHSSSAITDKYIDIELKERHKSAKNKLIANKD